MSSSSSVQFNQDSLASQQRFRVALVCDFFFPRLGGVQTHIFQLALALIELGHQVIVITHSYNTRTGVRYITNGLKVYYCPLGEFVSQATFISVYMFLPLMRKILEREDIEIVHTHQSTSILGFQAIIHSRTLGRQTVYTDHSLFGFKDEAEINLNKMLKVFLSDFDHAISVSHTSKENLTLRACLDPRKISVIPNAVDCSRFQPDPSQRYPLNTINIVSINRLTFRKGVDLLIDVIPAICKKFPETHFIIGGDGPQQQDLLAIIEQHKLHDRVELLGSLPHREVRNVLVRGHIFLNTSLTEAFCIAIVEAASCGLLVVSTNVGGVTQVLPHNMVYLADPNPPDIIEKLIQAIPNAKNVPAHSFHEQCKQMYNWTQVAKRTEKVYDQIMKNPRPSIKERFKRYYSAGPIVGILAIGLILLDLIFYFILCMFTPNDKIQRALEFPHKKYHENQDKYGDHQFSVLPPQQK